MPRIAKNIYKRKDGRWEGRYAAGKKADGRTKYISVYGKTYAETKKMLFDLQMETKTIYPKTQKLFSSVLDAWLLRNELQHKPSTNLKYEYLIEKHIKPDLGGYNVQELNSNDINSFLNKKIKMGNLHKNEGLSPSYVRTMALIIQSSLDYAAEKQMCKPLKGVCKPISLKNNIKVLSPMEQQILENYLSLNTSLTGLGILLALNTGMRIGEICALQWENVDLSYSVIHVRTTVSRVKCTDLESDAVTKLIIDVPKTKSSIRDIPITSKMKPILSAAKACARFPFLISDSASFMRPRTLEYRFHKILEECNLPSINFHALRHTFATKCIENGVDIKSLSEILGHSNVGITLNTYVHSSMELKRQQLEKIN